MSSYDSRPDTRKHIQAVKTNVLEVIENLHRRANEHDLSKLESPEKEWLDEIVPRLARTTYGSPEYRETLKTGGEARSSHYARNDHHPEHHSRGIADMSLMALLEMLCDWRAASARHDDGDLRASLDHNVERFMISPQLASVLRRTIEEMGW